jgi:superfamily II DNA or RNA helicase
VQIVTPQELFDGGYATPVKIEQILLSYTPKKINHELALLAIDKKTDNSKILRLEKKLITTNKKRLKYILDLTKSFKNNSLLLFQDVAGQYGKNIYNILRQDLDSEKYEIFYVSGEIDKGTRERYRKLLNKTDKIRIMVASYGVFSTGIDVNNIHHIVLLESYKSEKIIKQSIGRGMRLANNKDCVCIYDIVDDFRCDGWLNFTFKHAVERKRIYNAEGFALTKKKIDLNQKQSLLKYIQ